MNITINAAKYQLSPQAEELVKERLTAALKLLGSESEGALLEIEVEEVPAEGRSSTPCRLIARLTAGGRVYHAETVKPTPESAADRVRAELEAEIRRARGRGRALVRRGSAALKRMLRFGR